MVKSAPFHLNQLNLGTRDQSAEAPLRIDQLPAASVPAAQDGSAAPPDAAGRPHRHPHDLIRV
jgi:hypothetical protein